jgi:hypothetical protein
MYNDLKVQSQVSGIANTEDKGQENELYSTKGRHCLIVTALRVWQQTPQYFHFNFALDLLSARRVDELTLLIEQAHGFIYVFRYIRYTMFFYF